MRTVALICSIVIANIAMGQPKSIATSFGWQTDYSKAKEEAKRTNKPMFVVFRCEP